MGKFIEKHRIIGTENYVFLVIFDVLNEFNLHWLFFNGPNTPLCATRLEKHRICNKNEG